jgi:predicted nucleic acid-binding protein
LLIDSSILIAATAMRLNVPVATFNERHFVAIADWR